MKKTIIFIAAAALAAGSMCITAAATSGKIKVTDSINLSGEHIEKTAPKIINVKNSELLSNAKDSFTAYVKENDDNSYDVVYVEQ